MFLTMLLTMFLTMLLTMFLTMLLTMIKRLPVIEIPWAYDSYIISVIERPKEWCSGFLNLRVRDLQGLMRLRNASSNGNRNLRRA
jgi:hypothetical protein